jgi:pyruvate dehydrogenase E1 component beta subunit
MRVTGFDTPYPPARIEDDWLPGVDRVLDALERVLGY